MSNTKEDLKNLEMFLKALKYAEEYKPWKRGHSYPPKVSKKKIVKK